MPAYLVVRLDVTDWNRYQQYTKATPQVIARYGGKFLVRGGRAVALEGEPENRRLVVIEFPSMKKLQDFFSSPEYLQVKKLREGAAIGQFLAVEGFAG